MTRREGLKAAAMTALSYSQVLGANNRIRAGLIGCGNRGVNALLKATLPMDDVEVVAACDVFKPNLDGAIENIRKAGGNADAYGNYHEVVERNDIDAVMIATPDHWHTPILVDACNAGMDVYVEKPLANSIEDCLACVEAARDNERIVQLGAQQRSMRIYHDALAMIQDGRFGRIQRCAMVWGGDASSRPGGLRRAPQDLSNQPEGLDWEMWQGPAPRHAYNYSRQRSWRNYWEYGSGVITDFGVHLVDVTHWFMGVEYPLSCYGVGYSSPSRPTDQVPNVVSLSWKYENDFISTYMGYPDRWGSYFFGENGAIHVTRSGIHIWNGGQQIPSDAPAEEIRATDPPLGEPEHLRNFYDCLRTRQRPNLPVDTGANSTIACLLAARSVRTGRAYYWDWVSESAQEV